MALGYLAILYSLLIVLALVFQFLFYSRLDKFSYLVNMIYSLSLTYLVYSSQPSNYMVSKSVAIFFGLLSVVSFIIRDKKSKLSRLLMSLSILAGLVQLFL